ncbi:MAG: integrase [Jatrophihabitantaceae bacterium]|nr:integrase [Jatrophihabitantaceae bacterium]
MAQRVAAMDVRMAAAVADPSVNVAVFCRERGISRQTFYKWRARFAAEGAAGLGERSRRPRSAPGRAGADVEDAVVRARKVLADDGADHGPQSIVWALEADPGLAGRMPSRTTVWRILVRRGLIEPQPAKRPRSSMHRFAYARPNECWQSDWTAWFLGDGTKCAIAGTLDDHSRFLAGLRAAPGDGDTALVWATMLEAIARCGVPSRSLTDNGLCYSGARRGFEVPFEANLRALGVHAICSSPYHPGTCGKIERLWQTLKKWLAAHGPYAAIGDLNAALDAFAEYYNRRRRHRALHGATPAAVFAATPRARPSDRPLPAPTHATRLIVGGNGAVRLGGSLQLGIGKSWAGEAIDVIHDGDRIAVFHHTQLLGAIDIDPARRYQNVSAKRYKVSAMS